MRLVKQTHLTSEYLLARTRNFSPSALSSCQFYGADNHNGRLLRSFLSLLTTLSILIFVGGTFVKETMIRAIFFILTAILSSCSSLRLARRCASRNVRIMSLRALTDDRLTERVTDLFLDSPEEVRTPKKLSLQGLGIPKWLTGTLFRNGPGLFGAQGTANSGENGGRKDAPLRTYNHVFDGLAKITRYHFGDDNSVTFSSRFIDSNIYKVHSDSLFVIC